MDGALVLDKPDGMTSHDAVLAARRLLGEKRIGHLGTLDPFATGVLVLLIGRATRLAQFYRDRTKTYCGVARFGYATDTGDRTGIALGSDAAPQLNRQQLCAIFEEFLGPRLQQPPAVSAKKLVGTPAYKLARRGVAVELKPVPVVIHALQLRWVEGARAGFQATVSSGTYLRALVRDMGQRLGVGAHLEELRRVAVGEFTERNALKLEELADRASQGTVPLLPLEELLPEIPRVVLTHTDAERAIHGGVLRLAAGAPQVALKDRQQRLLGIAERVAENLYHPKVVLVTETSGCRPGLPEPSANRAGPGRR
ncbi:MAG TPA: tRNA pseudouridine(55) synthase TruB [Terriglobia bacterium]|nr:tRNA pseudouridine(55) synthase TruB [Terriglobia bacterium]